MEAALKDVAWMATRVTQIAVEVLDQPTAPNARVTQIAVEVLVANGTAPQPMSVGIIG